MPQYKLSSGPVKLGTLQMACAICTLNVGLHEGEPHNSLGRHWSGSGRCFPYGGRLYDLL